MRGWLVRSSAAAALLAAPSCSAAAPDAPSSPAAAAPAAIHDSLLVIGDSYAAGVGADTALTSFGWRLGRDLGFVTVVDGVGGTGFVNPGPGGADQTYSSRLSAIPDTELGADVVVVEGGLNDRQYPAPQVRSAADAFLTELVARAPGAVVVLVGAPAPAPDAPDASAAVNSALAQAARANDVAFVNPTSERWFTDANIGEYLEADQLHPNQAGHDYFARRIADAVEPLLPG